MTKKTKTMKKAREYPTRIYLRKLQQGYMRKQREVEENYLAQQPSWLINNTNFCYDSESLTDNDNEKKTILFTS